MGILFPLSSRSSSMARPYNATISRPSGWCGYRSFHRVRSSSVFVSLRLALMTSFLINRFIGLCEHKFSTLMRRGTRYLTSNSLERTGRHWRRHHRSRRSRWVQSGRHGPRSSRILFARCPTESNHVDRYLPRRVRPICHSQIV